MIKHFVKKLTLLSTLSLLPLAADSQTNSWPMSGGPEGNWQVTTDQHVPTEWSVRTGKNIKWRTELPEGGQSGIAVWGNRLFLTINPEKDTPAYSELTKEYESLKAQYDSEYKNTLTQLQSSSEFKKKKDAVNAAKKAWDDEFNEKTKKLKGNAKNRYKKVLDKSAFGKNLKKNQQDLFNYIHTDKKFKELHTSMTRAQQAMKAGASDQNIDLVCLDADNGQILWQKTVKGLMGSGYHYGFSDSTTPCPATDGKYVWAINASGGMACFDFDGNEIWSRTWMPTGGRPFNKQFDSILYGDSILNVEPPDEGDSSRDPLWNYLRAIDKNTGKTQWVCKDAITHYNAPVMSTMADGTPAVLIARGGPHGVPERPVGLSMVNLSKGKAGEVIWRWEPKEDNKISGGGALTTQHWDQNKAYWFLQSNGLSHISIDSKTGKQINTLPLNIVNKWSFEKESSKYTQESDFKETKFDYSRHCNIIVGDYLLYLKRYTAHAVRHNTKTGKTEVLELPTEVIRKEGQADQFLYGTKETSDTLNSKGQLHGKDNRTRGDGFQKCFLGSPTVLNGKIYFTNAHGLTYVLDALVPEFNKKSIIAVNDLGARGKTWTVGSLSYADGKIYHRDLKAVICVE